LLGLGDRGAQVERWTPETGKIMRNIAMLLSALMATVAHGASTPEPTRSEYLVTTAAGFLFDPDGGTHYALSFDILKTPASTLYVIVEFESTVDSGRPMVTEVVVQPGKQNFQTRSPSVHEIRNNRRYGVNLKLYSDAACTQLIGTHHQDVLFSVPRQMKPQVAEQFGVTIR
jgi:hypothetical protein